MEESVGYVPLKPKKGWCIEIISIKMFFKITVTGSGSLLYLFWGENIKIFIKFPKRIMCNIIFMENRTR
ncbi:hypothetical protein JCM17380_39780 [Desulfosporosinus burensis]